jgi:hypothetical protein
MNLGREMVDEKRIVVKHISGEDMFADGFSKPYDPAEHRKLKSILMPSVNGDNGWALSKVQGEDPGEIRAESQDGTQQHTKRWSVEKGRNGKVK